MFIIASRKKQGGFTIIELLVAATVTLVLVGLMLQVTIQTLGVWNQTSGKLTSQNQAKVVLDYLEQDFQGLVMRNDGNAWLLATIENPNGANFDDAEMEDAEWTNGGMTAYWVKPAGAANAESSPDDSYDVQSQETNASRRDLSEYRFGQAGVWLRMITNEPAANGESNLRAVGYQIVRISPVDENTSGADSVNVARAYQLYRSSVDADDTFAAGYNLALLAPAAGDGYNKPSGTSGNAGNISRPNRAYLLANNVVDFGVRLWSKNNAGNLTLLFPNARTSKGFSGPSGVAVDPPPPSDIGVANMEAGTPAVADLFVRVLTDEGARLLENFEYGRTGMEEGFDTGDEDKYWWYLVLKHSQVYTRRVAIPAVAN